MKDSYLNKERKNNADFMRKTGNEDTLASRKSIGRHAKSKAIHAKMGDKQHTPMSLEIAQQRKSRREVLKQTKINHLHGKY